MYSIVMSLTATAALHGTLTVAARQARVAGGMLWTDLDPVSLEHNHHQ